MSNVPSVTQSAFAQALLAPQAIALVGVSADPAKNTARPLRFTRKHGYTGRLYPVNPGRSEVMGERAYPSVGAIPDQIDHVFVMIPGAGVLPILEDCAARGARVVTIYSDGFAETGPEGAERQRALVNRAHELGLRLLGPNCIGTANAHTGGIVSVNAVFEMEDLKQGDISVVSQSGSMMGSLLSRAAARGFGFAKSVSVGNECDISVGEVVDALVDDPQTGVILLFLETLRDHTRLTAALARARAAGKPVIAYKLGRSEIGNALSESHTGAIAGNDAAIDAYFRAHGVRRVEMLETLFEAAPLLTRYPQARAAAANARIAVITTTGGGAATVVDRLGLRGMTAAIPPDAFIEHMAQRGLRIRPAPVIDLTLAASSAQYQDLLEQLLQSDWCDAVLSVAGSSAQFHPELVVKPLLHAAKPADKPLAAFLAPEAPVSLALLQAAGIAAFRTPEACADALAALFDQGRPPPAVSDAPRWPDDLPRTGALTEAEACRLFGLLGVPTARTQVLPIGQLQHDVPYPVVVKICSRDILHKTEVGGVRVGVQDDAALRQAADDILHSVAQHAPQAQCQGLLVQAMASRLIELMLGYRNDPLVGPTVVLSAGGIAAELAEDYAIRLAPVDEDQAWSMIEEVRHTQLVRGFRGLPQADCQVLAQAIAAFSKLAVLQGAQVEEAEINPLFIQADRVVAVDGLVRLRTPQA